MTSPVIPLGLRSRAAPPVRWTAADRDERRSLRQVAHEARTRGSMAR